VDSRQRDVLEAFVRRALARDLDQLAAEVDELRRELHASRLAHGEPIDPRRYAARCERTVALRAEGLSTRAIAAALGSTRSRVETDLRHAGAARPETIIGLDGRRTHGP
jgi:hypothetical protein